jgi:hypothetical protein
MRQFVVKLFIEGCLIQTWEQQVMMDFDGKDMQDGFQAAFGQPIAEATPEQIQWIVNVANHCRGRCRSKAALYNYLRRNLIGHNFKEMPVEGKDYTRLEITPKPK